MSSSLASLSRFHRLILRVAVIALTVSLAAACQHRPPTPPEAPTTTPPPVQPPRAIDRELPVLPMPDTACLAGRTVCLDPGHGGPWPGAVAPSNGIRECDINLRVALALRDMLTEAGARVVMTRTSNETPDPNSAGGDLAKRAEIANASNADVFVSVHHNADIQADSGKNALEVYYKMGDEAPSLDVAQCLTRALVAFLRRDATAKLLLPGNYKVLRQTEIPAVLIESAYLTESSSATFLASSEAAQTEARAVLAGLAFYFSLDPPTLAKPAVVASEDGRSHQIRLQLSRGGAIDPQSVEVLLDGKPADGEFVASTSRGSWVFRDVVPNGTHEALIVLRNTRGAATRCMIPFDVTRCPASLSVRQFPSELPVGSNIEVLFEVHVLDALGYPVPDGTEVTCPNADGNASTHDGVARFYIPARKAPDQLGFQVGNLSTDTNVKHAAQSPAQLRTLRITAAQTRKPVNGAVATSADATAVSTPEGWLLLSNPASSAAIECAGYRPATVKLNAAHTQVALQPEADGVLRGKRIVLDPAFGGNLAGAIGPLGTRACDINLDVAKRLAAQLRQAGATVVLTRDDDSDPSNLQRVAVTAQRSAPTPDLFITIAFGSPTDVANALNVRGIRRDDVVGFIGHYPGSDAGERLASEIARRLGNIETAPSAAYVIRQTPCPAIWICPDTIEDAQTEARYLNVDSRTQIATQIFQGILAHAQTK